MDGDRFGEARIQDTSLAEVVNHNRGVGQVGTGAEVNRVRREVEEVNDVEEAGGTGGEGIDQRDDIGAVGEDILGDGVEDANDIVDIAVDTGRRAFRNSEGFAEAEGLYLDFVLVYQGDGVAQGQVVNGVVTEVVKDVDDIVQIDRSAEAESIAQGDAVGQSGEEEVAVAKAVGDDVDFIEEVTQSEGQGVAQGESIRQVRAGAEVDGIYQGDSVAQGQFVSAGLGQGVKDVDCFIVVAEDVNDQRIRDGQGIGQSQDEAGSRRVRISDRQGFGAAGVGSLEYAVQDGNGVGQAVSQREHEALNDRVGICLVIADAEDESIAQGDGVGQRQLVVVGLGEGIRQGHQVIMVGAGGDGSGIR